MDENEVVTSPEVVEEAAELEATNVAPEDAGEEVTEE